MSEESQPTELDAWQQARGKGIMSRAHDGAGWNNSAGEESRWHTVIPSTPPSAHLYCSPLYFDSILQDQETQVLEACLCWNLRTVQLLNMFLLVFSYPSNCVSELSECRVSSHRGGLAALVRWGLTKGYSPSLVSVKPHLMHDVKAPAPALWWCKGPFVTSSDMEKEKKLKTFLFLPCINLYITRQI